MTAAAGQAAVTSKAVKWIIVTLVWVLLGLVLYVASFFALRWLKPAIINTNDGPIGIYRGFYYPLRAMTAHRHGLMRHWWDAHGQRRATYVVSYFNEGGLVYLGEGEEETKIGHFGWAGPAGQLDPLTVTKSAATIRWRSILDCDDDFVDRWVGTLTSVEWEYRGSARGVSARQLAQLVPIPRHALGPELRNQ